MEPLTPNNSQKYKRDDDDDDGDYVGENDFAGINNCTDTDKNKSSNRPSYLRRTNSRGSRLTSSDEDHGDATMSCRRVGNNFRKESIDNYGNHNNNNDDDLEKIEGIVGDHDKNSTAGISESHSLPLVNVEPQISNGGGGNNTGNSPNSSSKSNTASTLVITSSTSADNIVSCNQHNQNQNDNNNITINNSRHNASIKGSNRRRKNSRKSSTGAVDDDHVDKSEGTIIMKNDKINNEFELLLQQLKDVKNGVGNTNPFLNNGGQSTASAAAADGDDESRTALLQQRRRPDETTMAKDDNEGRKDEEDKCGGRNDSRVDLKATRQDSTKKTKTRKSTTHLHNFISDDDDDDDDTNCKSEVIEYTSPADDGKLSTATAAKYKVRHGRYQSRGDGYNRGGRMQYDTYSSIARQRKPMMARSSSGKQMAAVLYDTETRQEITVNYPTNKSAIPTCSFNRQDYDYDPTKADFDAAVTSGAFSAAASPEQQRKTGSSGGGKGGNETGKGFNKRSLVKSLDLFNFSFVQSRRHSSSSDLINMKSSTTLISFPHRHHQKVGTSNIYYPIPAKYRRSGNNADDNNGGGTNGGGGKYLDKLQARVRHQLDKLEEKCKRGVHKSPAFERHTLTKNYDIDDFIAATSMATAASAAAAAAAKSVSTTNPMNVSYNGAQNEATDNNKPCDRPNHNKFLYKSYKSEIDLTKNLTYLDAFLDEKFDNTTRRSESKTNTVDSASEYTDEFEWRHVNVTARDDIVCGGVQVATSTNPQNNLEHRRTRSYSKNDGASINNKQASPSTATTAASLLYGSSSLSSGSGGDIGVEYALPSPRSNRRRSHQPYHQVATTTANQNSFDTYDSRLDLDTNHLLYDAESIDQAALDNEVATAFMRQQYAMLSANHHPHDDDLLGSVDINASVYGRRRSNSNSNSNSNSATYHENYLDHYHNKSHSHHSHRSPMMMPYYGDPSYTASSTLVSVAHLTKSRRNSRNHVISYHSSSTSSDQSGELFAGTASNATSNNHHRPPTNVILTKTTTKHKARGDSTGPGSSTNSNGSGNTATELVVEYEC